MHLIKEGQSYAVIRKQHLFIYLYIYIYIYIYIYKTMN